jgi:hypothetical protein
VRQNSENPNNAKGGPTHRLALPGGRAIRQIFGLSLCSAPTSSPCPQEIHNTKVVCEVDLANFSCQIPVINITTSPRFLDNYIRDGSLLRKESGHPRMWPLLRRLDGAIANVWLSSTPSAGTSARRVPLPSTPTSASTSQYSEAAGRERERQGTNILGSVGDIVDIKVNGAVQKG